MIIPPGLNLPDPIRNRLGQKSVGRQRIIFEDGHLLIILHRPPGPDDSSREGVMFYRAPDGNWKWSRGAGGGPALNAHIQAYADKEASLSSSVESAKDTKTLYELQAEIAPVARSARNMHLTLQAARDAVKSEKILIDARDRAYELDRNLELLQEEVRNAIQYRSVREMEEQSRLSGEVLRATHRLNIMAALFLPLSAISGIFAMNLAPAIDASTAIYFWAIVAIAIGLGFALKSWVTQPTWRGDKEDEGRHS